MVILEQLNNNCEIEYLRRVCDIQEKCLNGEIDREEYRQKKEIERLKFIAYLSGKNQGLMQAMSNNRQMQNVLQMMATEDTNNA